LYRDGASSGVAKFGESPPWTIIDIQWRLNCVRSLEEGMPALGHNSPAGQLDYGHPETNAALTCAVTLSNLNKMLNLAGVKGQQADRKPPM
jgi:hypothetical protein